MQSSWSPMTFALAIGLLASSPVRAAPADGRWIAEIPAQGRCNYTGTMAMVVADGTISGHVSNGGATQGNFTGTVDANGAGSFLVNGRYRGVMTFTGDRFDATWNNGQCDRHAQGDRAATADQQAAEANLRKQRQADYADLVRRAEAGDRTVDYTALRREAVYAEHWDFYDPQGLNGLLQQGAAAAKGKDCIAALEKADAVIRLDFTIDAAHALKAECLRKTGERDRAEVEDDIARGLIHSLMDSGHGDTEHNAYVVNSLREEMDVLANRHIQLKARQTELRGSDGRYYDLVTGLSIGAGVSVKTVYFDITNFVTGRASRRAMAQTAAMAMR